MEPSPDDEWRGAAKRPSSTHLQTTRRTEAPPPAAWQQHHHRTNPSDLEHVAQRRHLSRGSHKYCEPRASARIKAPFQLTGTTDPSRPIDPGRKRPASSGSPGSQDKPLDMRSRLGRDKHRKPKISRTVPPPTATRHTPKLVTSAIPLSPGAAPIMWRKPAAGPRRRTEASPIRPPQPMGSSEPGARARAMARHRESHVTCRRPWQARDSTSTPATVGLPVGTSGTRRWRGDGMGPGRELG